jgi:ATP-dependent DNA helicase
MGEPVAGVFRVEPAGPQSRVWMKVSSPEPDLPALPREAEKRVLLPDDPRFLVLRDTLAAQGVEVRQLKYLIEDETVVTEAAGGLTASVRECRLTRPAQRELLRLSGEHAEVARQNFSLLWDLHATADAGISAFPRTETAVPAEWLRYLPHPTLNPAQAEAIPHVRDGREHLLIVAPTGAGKTVIGMAAALRTVLQEGRKAAWLVPQRSLTDELNSELEHWRRQGMQVERLSGEYGVDIERVRDADLWVATTEKFEAICRASSFREALAEVGCLVVDEIHLLGDQERGPVLEALLARVRDADAGMRVVGLSATVSNANEIVAWLGARLVHLTWRPSRLTWQLPVIAANRDWSVVETARMRMASAITAMVTQDEGSILVFCGSKRNVRRTALLIAGSRGAHIDGVHPDDLDRLQEVCERVGVGLHYKGWEHKRKAERQFRARELDVLVATSTVAAGVNLPARAVVIQDTEVGMKPIDVATVQQMFGRAGRVGAGENEGWAFLVVTEDERVTWQSRLVIGHSVHSQIRVSLADHLLAEAVQGRIGSLREAERWWIGTLAHHQGNRDLVPLANAVEFLIDGVFISRTGDSDGDVLFTPTELGKLTARLMVSTTIGHDLRMALADTALPDTPEEAERALIELASTLVPKLAKTAVSEELKPHVGRLLRADGEDSRPGDLARAALLLVADAPDAFRRGARTIAGIPYMALYPALEEAPRYLHWIGAQGLLGTVPPWSAIVAADLSRRVRWRRCQPPRSAGRLLWMCEQMATTAHVDDAVPRLWRAAMARGITSPDWTVTGRPQHSHLDEEAYRMLLRARATEATITFLADRTEATGPEGSVLATWVGRRHEHTAMPHGKASVNAEDGDGLRRSAAIFTRRGDYRATGWLDQYTRCPPARADSGILTPMPIRVER